MCVASCTLYDGHLNVFVYEYTNAMGDTDDTADSYNISTAAAALMMSILAVRVRVMVSTK